MKIIAEVGSNWATLEDCKKSIQLAKACGADAVKFQLFDDIALYGQPRTDRIFAEYNPLIDKPQGVLPIEWLPILKEKADAFGIEFMCSAFSPELIEVVDPFVKTHKVASAELTHVRMLEKLRAIRKPVILSTGASGDADIRMAIETLADTPVTLMYCVAEYPARIVSPGRIQGMHDTFGVDVGFSDHTTDVLCIPIMAMDAGATVIEKHVNFVGAQGPDADYALTTDEFRIMCDGLRGNTIRAPAEKDMRLRHNRRLIAIRDIAVGETLKEGENFGIFRSLKDDTQALTPWVVNRVNGKMALAAVKAGDGIGPNSVQL